MGGEGFTRRVFLESYFGSWTSLVHSALVVIKLKPQDDGPVAFDEGTAKGLEYSWRNKA